MAQDSYWPFARRVVGTTAIVETTCENCKQMVAASPRPELLFVLELMHRCLRKGPVSERPADVDRRRAK